jgi:hypothetical protein
MTKLLTSTKEAEQDEDVILKRTDLAAYDDNNARLDEWLLKHFLEILGGEENRCRSQSSLLGRQVDSRGVVLRQTTGQQRLEATCLPLMVT